MTENRTVRTVTLEFLRAGPPHNQLLSPLTPYLAVCGEAGAAVVHVPWEHAPFLRRIEELRYADASGEESPQRLIVLDETGQHIAALLGSIPAMSGVIGGEHDEGEVTHLRLVVSASELALVPFELSKVPSGLELPADSWLLLQANTPVCLTRHVRSVPYEGVPWDREARILFIASNPDELESVFDDHREALIDAVRPWLKPGQEKGFKGSVCDEERFGDVLTIKSDATISDVRALCAKDCYTHVHLLAHGARDDSIEWPAYGIGLGGQIITGTRFASAVTRSSPAGIERPTIVTLASCDSANVGSVMSAGASFAHAVHQAGIPMVVASQFPLSFPGSVTALQEMYGSDDGFLWGRNPIFMLQDLRRSLQISTESQAHDWASIVVYEALPPTRALEEELGHYGFRQVRNALRTAERGLKDVIKSFSGDKYETVTRRLGESKTLCQEARGRMPEAGPYVIEALALSGANYKKLAEAEFLLARSQRAQGKRTLHLKRSLKFLDDSYGRYTVAVDKYMNPQTGAQLRAQPHYVSVQAIAGGMLLGKEPMHGLWQFARLSAEAHQRLSDDEERAWAHGTLIELHLLAVADPGLPLSGAPIDATATPTARHEDAAIRHARALVSLFPARGAFPIFSTYRQLRRYTDWWGDAAFLRCLEDQGLNRSWDVAGAWDDVARVVGVIQSILKPKLWQSQQKG